MVFHNNFNLHSATVKLNRSKLILERQPYAQLVSGCHYSPYLGPQCLEAAESSTEGLPTTSNSSWRSRRLSSCQTQEKVDPHPDIFHLEGKF